MKKNHSDGGIFQHSFRTQIYLHHSGFSLLFQNLFCINTTNDKHTDFPGKPQSPSAPLLPSTPGTPGIP